MMTKARAMGILSLHLVLIVTAGALISRFLPFTSAIPLFLIPLLFIAWRYRFGPASIACLVTTLTLDFFFTEPRRTLRVGSPQDVAALLSFLIVVLFVSRISSSLAEKASHLERRDEAQKALQELAERSLMMDWREPVAQGLCAAVRSCFSLESVCLWDSLESQFACDGSASDSTPVRAAFMAERDFDLPQTRQSIRILRSGIRPIGSLQLLGELPDASVIGSIASLVALSMERARALNGEVFAQSERTSEQLRTTVLDGLAHSIKTPLTTIALSSAGAVAIGGLNEAQVRLLRLVEEQTHYVSGLTNSLLQTAKLEAKVSVHWHPVDLGKLARTLVEESEQASRFYLLGMDAPLPISSDPALLRMVFIQVLENALKYSPADSLITLTAERGERTIVVSIHNRGSYIPSSESKLVFKRFYRSPNVVQCAPGTGLGLSVARQSVEALGGQITVESDHVSGTTFLIELPIGGNDHAGLSSHR